MYADMTESLGGNLMQWGSGTLPLAVACLLLLSVVLVLVMVIFRSRRRERSELREIVLALEEMREGRLRRKPTAEGGSPVAVVAPAGQRHVGQVDQVGRGCQQAVRAAGGGP